MISDGTAKETQHLIAIGDLYVKLVSAIGDMRIIVDENISLKKEIELLKSPPAEVG